MSVAMHVVYNLCGVSKRFRMIDGVWEKHDEAISWMSDRSPVPTKGGKQKPKADYQSKDNQ